MGCPFFNITFTGWINHIKCMQSPATFMISVITFKSPIFKKNIKEFHITLGVQLLASALSFFHLSNMSVSAKWKNSQMQANKHKTFFLSLKEYLTQAILAVFYCRTTTTRVMAKFAPGSVAHPAAAWVPQLVRKYLTAVQRCGPFCKGKWELPEDYRNAKCQTHAQLKPLPRSAFPSTSYTYLLGF